MIYFAFLLLIFFSIFDSCVVLLFLNFFKHESMLFFNFLTEIHRIQFDIVQSCYLISNRTIVFRQSFSDRLIQLSVCPISAVAHGSMNIVGMRRAAFDKHKGNVSDSAVIHKILERVWPIQHTKSSEQFENYSNRNKASCCEKIEKKAILRGES